MTPVFYFQLNNSLNYMFYYHHKITFTTGFMKKCTQSNGNGGPAIARWCCSQLVLCQHYKVGSWRTSIYDPRVRQLILLELYEEVFLIFVYFIVEKYKYSKKFELVSADASWLTNLINKIMIYFIWPQEKNIREKR